MKNKIITGIVISTTLGLGLISFTSADFGNFTDEEKTTLDSMTKEEKRDFFLEKREERHIEKEAHKNVINKLIYEEELTPDERVVLEEIKTIRAEREENRLEREALMEEIKPILSKVRAGETLTDEEKIKFEEFKNINPGIGKGKCGQKSGGGAGLMGR